MSQEIIGSTKVTIKGKEYECKSFPEIWELFKANNISIDDENKGYLIRVLFINGYVDLNEYGADVKLEVIW